MSFLYLKILRIMLFVICVLAVRLLILRLLSNKKILRGKYDIEIIAPSIILAYILGTAIYFAVRKMFEI